MERQEITVFDLNLSLVAVLERTKHGRQQTTALKSGTAKPDLITSQPSKLQTLASLINEKPADFSAGIKGMKKLPF